MKSYISKSTNDTLSWARKFARRLKGGEVVSLEGNLGAGKTVISKGIAQGLGVKEIVNSPTFVLMKVYAVAKHGEIKKLVHVDAYRLDSAQQLLDIGLADYLGQPDVVVLIEWGDKVKNILPTGTKRILLSQPKENIREIAFE